MRSIRERLNPEFCVIPLSRCSAHAQVLALLTQSETQILKADSQHNFLRRDLRQLRQETACRKLSQGTCRRS